MYYHTIYAPTAEVCQEDIEHFYRHLDTIIQRTKQHDLNIISEDFNAKVRNERCQGWLEITGREIEMKEERC